MGGSPIFVTGFPSNPKTISTEHYSLDVQYQLPFNTVATVGYQGNRTRNLLIQNNWLAIGGANGLAMNPQVNFVDYYENAGDSNFNAMVASVAHNFSHTFQASAQYTWAKALDENSGPYEEDPYPFNTAAAYGRSDYNVENAFKLFGLWQPVIFHGNHSWAEKLVGGWSLSGIWNLHSGFPWNPNDGANNLVSSRQRLTLLLRPACSSWSRLKHQQQDLHAGHEPELRRVTAPSFSWLRRMFKGRPFPAFSPAPTPGKIERNSLNGPRI